MKAIKWLQAILLVGLGVVIILTPTINYIDYSQIRSALGWQGSEHIQVDNIIKIGDSLTFTIYKYGVLNYITGTIVTILGITKGVEAYAEKS
jgi:hypothetical protein